MLKLKKSRYVFKHVSGMEAPAASFLRLKTKMCSVLLIISMIFCWFAPVGISAEEQIHTVWTGEDIPITDISTDSAVDTSTVTPPAVQPQEPIMIGEQDFSLTIDDKSYAKKRTAEFTVLNNQAQALAVQGASVRLSIWKLPDNEVLSAESLKAQEPLAAIALEQTLALDQKLAWTINPADYINAYGTYCLGAVLITPDGEEHGVLAFTEFEVSVKYTVSTVKASKKLKKNAQFTASVSGVQSPFDVKSITFHFYDADGKEVYACKAAKNGKNYKKQISFKAFDYTFGTYSMKTVLTDKKEIESEISSIGELDLFQVQKGQITVRKKIGNAVVKLKKVSILGNLKKVQFTWYRKKNGKKEKEQSIKAEGNTAPYKAKLAFDEKGSYTVCAYATTTWGKQVLVGETSFEVTEKDFGKNGWYYEKYNGKKYKFYYENNQKVTDLTNILGIKESTTTNINNFYIEVNREANCVTIYAYNEETSSYDIPVKTCTVSVGRDTWSTSGSGSLSTNTSFTPLGDFSICTNGTSPKYTLKPMYEPDGSIVYARWASHVVGNVYFHAVAVGSQSHYALSPYTYNKLGTAASAGCIRMTVSDAKWIYDYVSVGSKVTVVKGNTSKPGPLGKNKTIKVSSSIHYDPTDPDVPDSRKKSDYSAGRISGYMKKDGTKVGY